MPDCATPLVSAEGTVIGQICHINADAPKGPRYDRKQTNEERQSYENLMLMCPTHHKIIDTETRKYTTNKLKLLKKQSEVMESTVHPQIDLIAQAILNNMNTQINTSGDSTTTNLTNISDKNSTIFQGAVNQAIVGNNNQVNQIINNKITNKKVTQKYPPGTLGASVLKANYIAHLTARYNEYKKIELDEIGEKLKYGAFGSALKKEFKLGATRTIYHAPEEQFEAISNYIQKRIKNTKFGKMRKGQKLYSTFEEYVNQINSKV